MGAGVVKVRVMSGQAGVAAQPPNAVEPEERKFRIEGALPPPYDPRNLCDLYERSSALRPNVEAYATNIVGFDHRFEPTLDLKADDVRERVQEAIILDKLFEGELPTVSQAEVDAKLVEIESVMRLEKVFIESWFTSCCQDESFTEVREKTRTDLEVTGNWYWEIIRNRAGQITQIEHVPSVSMRLMELERDRCEVDALRRVSAISLRRMPRARRFRRYVQMVEGVETVYFKELGDPRTYSSKTGRRYDSVEQLQATESCPPATEILHGRIYSPLSAYGVPRWVGATPAVLGLRASEEVNVLYFDNKCIPPMAITVEGGSLEDGALEKIREVIAEQIKGRANFHGILLLEAAPASTGDPMAPSVVPRIKLEPLTQYQEKDALFQNYEANNAEKISQQFRLPRILRGMMTDFNKATADAAIEYTEQQVFQPQRKKDDHVLNERILIDLGVRFWRFVSGAPIVRDPPQLAKMIGDLVTANVLTPKEARELCADVFGRSFEVIDDDWTKKPIAMLMGKGSPAADAVKEIMALRAGLEQEQAQASASATLQAHQAETSDVEIIRLPASDFRSLFRAA